MGRGGGGWWKGGTRKRGRGDRKRGRGVRERSGGKGRGRGRGKGGRKTGGGAEFGRKGEHTGRPVNARIVANQPREAENQLEVAEPHDVTGKVFGVNPMNA